MYEAFINGTRVGDLELTPGISSYRRTLYVQDFDVAQDRDRLRWSPAPPVRAMESFAPVAIHRLPQSRQVVDFGQNLHGRVRLSRLGPSGTTITLTHGEALGADGDLTLSHLGITIMPGLPALPAGQVDTVISRGHDGDHFEPRHTSQGFRYVAVDGLDEDLTEDDISAHQLRSDLHHTGTFACSDDRINALHRIAVASWRANTLDIPTDCPHRERWGYTGDFQIFARSATFLDDVRGFVAKWLTSLADDQHPDGKITTVAPGCGADPDPVAPFSFDGSAGWGDAATIVPWELYRAYGDPGVLRTCLPMMQRWVDYAATAARSTRHPARAARHPQERPTTSTCGTPAGTGANDRAGWSCSTAAPPPYGNPGRASTPTAPRTNRSTTTRKER